MSLWPELRMVAWLKRIGLALERGATALETLAAAAAIENAPRPAPRLTEFESLDVAAANRDWFEREKREAEERGETVEEDR